MSLDFMPILVEVHKNYVLDDTASVLSVGVNTLRPPWLLAWLKDTTIVACFYLIESDSALQHGAKRFLDKQIQKLARSHNLACRIDKRVPNIQEVEETAIRVYYFDPKRRTYTTATAILFLLFLACTVFALLVIFNNAIQTIVVDTCTRSLAHWRHIPAFRSIVGHIHPFVRTYLHDFGVYLLR